MITWIYSFTSTLRRTSSLERARINDRTMAVTHAHQFYEVLAEGLCLSGIDDRDPDDILPFGASFFRIL